MAIANVLLAQVRRANSTHVRAQCDQTRAYPNAKVSLATALRCSILWKKQRYIEVTRPISSVGPAEYLHVKTWHFAFWTKHAAVTVAWVVVLAITSPNGATETHKWFCEPIYNAKANSDVFVGRMWPQPNAAHARLKA